MNLRTIKNTLNRHFRHLNSLNDPDVAFTEFRVGWWFGNYLIAKNPIKGFSKKVKVTVEEDYITLDFDGAGGDSGYLFGKITFSDLPPSEASEVILKIHYDMPVYWPDWMDSGVSSLIQFNWVCIDGGWGEYRYLGFKDELDASMFMIAVDGCVRVK